MIKSYIIYILLHVKCAVEYDKLKFQFFSIYQPKFFPSFQKRKLSELFNKNDTLE